MGRAPELRTYPQQSCEPPAHSFSELLRDLVESRNIPREDLECTGGAVVVTRPLIPYLQTLVAALESMRPVVLAMVRVLGFIHLDSLKDRLWPRHRIPPFVQPVTTLETAGQGCRARRA